MRLRTLHKRSRHKLGQYNGRELHKRQRRVARTVLIALAVEAERRRRADILARSICMACKHPPHTEPCVVRYGFGEPPNMGARTCLCTVFDVLYTAPPEIWNVFGAR